MSDQVAERLLSTTEVAERLGVSVPTVHRMLTSGELPVVPSPTGSKYKKVPLLAVTQLLKEQQQAVDDAMATWLRRRGRRQ